MHLLKGIFLRTVNKAFPREMFLRLLYIFVEDLLQPLYVFFAADGRLCDFPKHFKEEFLQAPQ